MLGQTERCCCRRCCCCYHRDRECDRRREPATTTTTAPPPPPTDDAHATEFERLVSLRRELADMRHSCAMGMAKLERGVELAEEALLNHIKKCGAESTTRADGNTCAGYHQQQQQQQQNHEKGIAALRVGEVLLSDGQVLVEQRDENGLASYRLRGPVVALL